MLSGKFYRRCATMSGPTSNIRPSRKAAPISTLSPMFPRDGLLQRKCACGENAGVEGECEGCRAMRLQRKSASRNSPQYAPPIVHDVLRSSGQSLDASTRSLMEPKFGFDLRAVRIHTDKRAAESARQVGALAYTVGHDVVFNTGHYQPETARGRQLIAHELTHVVQQAGAEGDVGDRLEIADPADANEREAERAGNRIATASPIEIQQRSRPTVSRYGHDPATCTQEFLEKRLWPGNELAKAMLAKAIQAMALTPRPSIVTRQFQNYFMTSSPDISEILRIYAGLKRVFDQNNYMFSC